MKILTGTDFDVEEHVAQLTSIAQLAGRFGPRVAKGVAALTIANQVYRMARTQALVRQRSRQYLITVESDDQMYPEIHGWVLSNLSPVERKALIARSRSSSRDEFEFASRQRSGRSVSLYYDGAREQDVVIDGHEVRVAVCREDTPVGAQMIKTNEKILFTCPDLAAREAVLELLQSLADVTNAREPRIYSSSAWGNWRGDTARPRPLESVILADQLQYKIRDDLETFLGSEDQYHKWGQPWRRGYLFYGPPGTGKTSLAQALATDLGLDIYVIQLPVLENDSALIDCLSSVGPRAILVLEDIDIVRAARIRDGDEPKGVTMGGLLNALDGMVTPHGLVTMMTTNDREALDAALIRPGRIDRQDWIGYCTWEQADGLCRWFTDTKLGVEPKTWRRDQVVPAELIATLRDAVNADLDVVDCVHKFLKGEKA